MERIMKTQHTTIVRLLLSGTLVSMVLICFPDASLGNDETAMSESYYFEEFPVTLTSTRLSQPFEDTPNAMTVIDKQMIRATGAMSIPDLLRLVPGFTVAFYAGSQAAVTYHGLADQYARDMQVLIDGRSVYDPGYGGVSWWDLPIGIEDINRIEVIRGPNATAYGSNSYAGVINIITDQPSDAYGSKVSVTAGEGGRRKFYGRHAAQTADFSFKVSGGYDEGEGFDERSDDFRAGWLSFHGDKQLDRDNQIKLLFGASQGVYEEGYSDVTQQIRDLDNDYHYLQCSWSHKQNDNNYFNLQIYHNHQEIKDSFMTPPISEMVMSLDALQSFPEPIRLDTFAMLMGAPDFNSFLNAMNITDGRFLISWLGMSSDRYDLEFEQTIQASKNFRLALGAGLRRDLAESIQIFHQTNPVSRNQARLFANGEWQAHQNLVINIGGMLEDYESHSPIFSYRAAGNYHLNRQNTFRLNAARAYRMPTLYEQYINFVIFLEEPFNDINTWIKTQGHLDPQRIDSLEVGYMGNFSEVGLTIDMKLFSERYRDVIISYPDYDQPDPDRGLADTTVLDNFNQLIKEGVKNYSNNGTVDTYGFEISAKFLPTYNDLIFLGYNYMHIDGTEIKSHRNGIDEIDDFVNLRAPSHTFSLLLSHRFDSGFEISTTYYYTDTVTWYGEGDEVPEYQRLDAKLAKRFKLFGSNSEISLLLQNFNKDNLEFYNKENYRNVWSKRAYLQINTTF